MRTNQLVGKLKPSVTWPRPLAPPPGLCQRCCAARTCAACAIKRTCSSSARQRALHQRRPSTGKSGRLDFHLCDVGLLPV